jgi:hypothetical protein
MKRGALVIAVTVATVVALPAPALGVAAFRTPKKAAYCGLTEDEGPPHLLCWTPNDGFTVDTSGRGRPRKRYVANNAATSTPPLEKSLETSEPPAVPLGRCGT